MNKPMMTFVLANRIVEAWYRDAVALSIPGVRDYLEDQDVFQILNVSTRVMLGRANPAASDALWEKDFRKAIAALRKYGLVEHRQDNLAPRTRGCYMGSARLSGSFSNPGADWKYVKAVRSK